MLPIRLFSSPEVAPEAVEAAHEALSEVVHELGRVANLAYFGTWRSPNWLDSNGILVPYQSLDWYFQDSYDSYRQQINISNPIDLLDSEPGKYDVDPHYDVVLVGHDIWPGVPEIRFIAGIAMGRSIIISTARFEHDRNMFPELVKQETAHEFGHLLGLGDREHRAEDNLGRHCINHACTMRQGLTVPTDWQIMTSERLANGNRYFCDDCHQDAIDNGTI